MTTLSSSDVIRLLSKPLVIRGQVDLTTTDGNANFFFYTEVTQHIAGCVHFIYQPSAVIMHRYQVTLRTWSPYWDGSRNALSVLAYWKDTPRWCANEATIISSGKLRIPVSNSVVMTHLARAEMHIRQTKAADPDAPLVDKEVARQHVLSSTEARIHGLINRLNRANLRSRK